MSRALESALGMYEEKGGVSQAGGSEERAERQRCPSRVDSFQRQQGAQRSIRGGKARVPLDRQGGPGGLWVLGRGMKETRGG